MRWIYLSPHFDDVALSCGGLVWEQACAGEQVGIWTVCAGPIPDGPLSAFARSLHARWGAGPEAVEGRRREDQAACARLLASSLHFSVPDCIYRRAELPVAGGMETDMYYYPSEASIFGPLHPGEAGLVRDLSAELKRRLPREARLVVPLALGGHVDHRLARRAAEALNREIWYYADYPYVLEHMEEIDTLRRSGWQASRFPVSDAGLEAWQGAVAEHRSQISTFWPDLGAMRLALQAYRERFSGTILLRPPMIEPGE
jgi:LmbE family N-acetylglucosaminyl deacetylase